MHKHYIFYKPYEVLSQFSAEGNKKTLAQFLSHLPKDVYPVGRLDYDSEGLLFLTNNRSLTHRLLDPKFRHPRTYFAQVEGNIPAEPLRVLSSGVTIRIDGKEHFTAPAIAAKIEVPLLPPRTPPIRFRAAIPTSWISLTLTEGKNRQVRRMTAAVGFPTLRLVRHAIGDLTIANMQAGDFRQVYEEDIVMLFA